MRERPYTIEEIRQLISPVAQRYGVERIYLFGSYARGEARPDSDIDLHIDKGNIRGYFELAGFHCDLEEALSASVDVVTTGAMRERFKKRVSKEEVLLYELPEH